MDNEVVELKEEIEFLKERITVLEKKERNRKTCAYIKMAFRVVLLLATIYGALKGYEYLVNEVPKIINEKIEEINPVNKNN